MEPPVTRGRYPARCPNAWPAINIIVTATTFETRARWVSPEIIDIVENDPLSEDGRLRWEGDAYGALRFSNRELETRWPRRLAVRLITWLPIHSQL